MEWLIKAGRSFYAIAIGGLGFQQFLDGAFRPVLLPAWPAWLPGLSIFAYLAGAALIACALAILFEKRARAVALVLGGVFLLLAVFGHLPYELFADPYNGYLYVWSNALKELTLSGGAFVIAGSYSSGNATGPQPSALTKLLEKFIPVAPVFFAIMLIAFGIEHFLYAGGVKTMVPAWIPPGQVFWTYFAAIALIGSGIALIFKIQLRLIATLLGIMIFCWFILLHIPRAAAAPPTDKGNELTSVFEALGFSGIAFVIACTVKKGKAAS
jgi:uncharacterized membrane protein YphA (DoxX/SURF4 family)